MRAPSRLLIRNMRQEPKNSLRAKRHEAQRPSRFLFEAIGQVANEFDDAAPPEEIRSKDSRIILDPRLVVGLQGLEVGHRILIVFCFHLSESCELLQHPRGDVNLPRRGVFSLRSPDRPNPIGVSVVDLLSMEENVLLVRGLDAMNTTPVLDIKPAGSSI